MSDSDYQQAQKLINELGSIRKAADALGVSYSTLRRELLKYESTPRAQSLEPESAPKEPSSDLLPPGFSEALMSLDVSRLQREAEQRRSVKNYCAEYGLEDDD